jgi:hypothetical protein
VLRKRRSGGGIEIAAGSRGMRSIRIVCSGGLPAGRRSDVGVSVGESMGCAVSHDGGRSDSGDARTV